MEQALEVAEFPFPSEGFCRLFFGSANRLFADCSGSDRGVSGASGGLSFDALAGFLFSSCVEVSCAFGR